MPCRRCDTAAGEAQAELVAEVLGKHRADEYHARVLVPEGLTASGRPGDDASNRTPRAEWVSNEEAARWLLLNDEDLPDELAGLEDEVSE